MKQCNDVERALGLASLGCGLLAAVVLSISVGADYWLLTDEPWALNISALPSDGPAGPRVEMFSTYSGLWRACVFLNPSYGSSTDGGQVDGGQVTTDDPSEEFSSGDSNDYIDGSDEPMTSCSNIAYFDQGFERIEGGETSTAIWRAIRRSTPVIMLSLLLMISAEVLAILGYLREDFMTVIGAIISIIAALSLALGQIFYISAVNDEASQWKRPEGATEAQKFAYGYGWAFYSTGSSFIIVMVAAVGHITVYLRRYVTNDIRRMLIIVPGLNVRKIEAAVANNTGNATAVGGVIRTASPSPTSPFGASQKDCASNGISRAATTHGTVESLAAIAAPPSRTMSPRPGLDVYHGFGSSTSPIIYRPLPLQPSSPPYDTVHQAALLMMATEAETPQQCSPAATISSPYQTGYLVTGSRVQSDIF